MKLEIDDVEESIVKKVKPYGNGANVIVPKSWIGRDVRILLIEKKEGD